MTQRLTLLICVALTIAGCCTRDDDGKGKKTLEPPFFIPGECVFNTVPFEVAIEHLDGFAEIFYSIDDTEPSDLSVYYTEVLKLTETTTIKAIAKRRGYRDSAVVTATFTYNKVATPVFSLEDRIYYEGQELEISTETEDAQIYYTINKFEPYQHEALLYTEPLNLPLPNAHYIRIQARAYLEDYAPSDVAMAIYEFKIPDMVYVEGGVFSANSLYLVQLSDYFIGNYEVTQAEWAEVMETNQNGISSTPSAEDKPNNPVEGISWYDAIVYCNLRSVAEGYEPVYSLDGFTDTTRWGVAPTTSESTNWQNIQADFTKDGYRLPTEMEWLYAARGGIHKAVYTYSGSFQADEVAWYDANADNQTHSAGLKAGNDLALFDMSGNVWEWCWDWLSAELPTGIAINPTGPASGEFRMLKGGSYQHSQMQCEVDFRAGRGNDWYRKEDWGLRVVRNAESGR